MSLDVKSKTQTETKLAYRAFILAWFCFLFFVYKLNFPRRTISAIALVALCLAAVHTIVIGFVMRKKFFKQSTEAFSGNPPKALHLWKAANVIGWCCAMNLTVFGVVLLSGWQLACARHILRDELRLSSTLEAPPAARERCSTPCLAGTTAQVGTGDSALRRVTAMGPITNLSTVFLAWL
jgi:hypothetical protein